jgi:hypothetical protein
MIRVLCSVIVVLFVRSSNALADGALFRDIGLYHLILSGTVTQQTSMVNRSFKSYGEGKFLLSINGGCNGPPPRSNEEISACMRAHPTDPLACAPEMRYMGILYSIGGFKFQNVSCQVVDMTRIGKSESNTVIGAGNVLDLTGNLTYNSILSV